MEMLYHGKIKTFIKSLQKPAQSKVLWGIELIEKYGINLGMPHVKKINRLLFELRIRDRQEVRIFYVIYGNKIVLLHGFIKKTQKTPAREIEVAENRWKQLTTI